jgi:hypothetical protein
MRSGQRIGSWVIAVALVGSLVFGLVYHFVFANPDHVAHVDPHWRPLFATTAALLAVTEALRRGVTEAGVSRSTKEFDSTMALRVPTSRLLPGCRGDPATSRLASLSWEYNVRASAFASARAYDRKSRIVILVILVL